MKIGSTEEMIEEVAAMRGLDPGSVSTARFIDATISLPSGSCSAMVPSVSLR